MSINQQAFQFNSNDINLSADIIKINPNQIVSGGVSSGGTITFTTPIIGAPSSASTISDLYEQIQNMKINGVSSVGSGSGTTISGGVTYLDNSSDTIIL